MNFIWQKSKERGQEEKEREGGGSAACVRGQSTLSWSHASCQKVIFIGNRQTISREANKSLAPLQRGVGGGGKRL